MRKSLIALSILLVFTAGCSIFDPYGRPEVLWKVDFVESKYASGGGAPVIGKDGSAYYSAIRTSDGEHYYLVIEAYSSEGELEWKREYAEGRLLPKAAADGNLLCETWWLDESNQSYNYNLNGISSSDGSILWSVSIEPLEYLTFEMGSDGYLYCLGNKSEGLTVRKLTQGGDRLWECQLDEKSWAELVIGSDGTLYVPTCEYPPYEARKDYLYAIEPNGTLSWKEESEYGQLSGIGPDGTFYFSKQVYDDASSTNRNFLHAVRADGSLKWKYEAGVRIVETKIAPDGKIYLLVDVAGDERVHLYVLSTDGSLNWKFEEGDVGKYLLGFDCSLYLNLVTFPAEHETKSYLYAFNPDKSVKWRYNHTGSFKVSGDGIVYLCAFEGYGENGLTEYSLQAIR